MSRHVCTVIAANYLPRARVLASSFMDHHPEGRVWVLVIDNPDITGAGEEFTVLHPLDIGFERAGYLDLASIYDVMELATAVKPWLLRHLVAELRSPLIYLDPDIEVYAPLDDLWDEAERSGIVVTPHLNRPLPRDGHRPNEADILGAGVYNLGFLGVGTRSLDFGFFEYWCERLLRDAIVDPPNMLFTDQRWIDFIDCFPHKVIRDPTCNLAYWNVWAHDLESDGEGVTVDGAILRFFHFSGFEPSEPYVLSKHQGESPRVRLSEQPALAGLCRRYAERLLQAIRSSDATGYGFAKSEGLDLTSLIRRIFRRALVEAETHPGPGNQRPPNPFADHDGFVAWLNEPLSPRTELTRYLANLHSSRPDLWETFHDPVGVDCRRYLDWAESNLVDPVPVDLVPSRANAATLIAPAEPTPRPLPGINVVGYFNAELGVGQAGRLLAAAVAEAGLPFALHAHSAPLSRMSHRFLDEGTAGWPYDVNVFCVNADETPHLAAALGPDAFAGRRTVGVWFWETERLPESMHPAFDQVDEVWTATDFVARALRRDSPVPVHVFPLPVPVRQWDTRITRRDLGLTDDFLVLCCLDLLSVPARKNPSGLIDAYCSAFGPDDGTTLVIKTINGDKTWRDLEALRLQTDRPDVHVIDGYLSASETVALIRHCDCYVSLHRSEGFGLTLAEAMSLGRPVIATGWSGNLQFMDESVSHLVPYRLVKIPDGTAPYTGTGNWADPDLDSAARLMRRVRDDRAGAAAMGQRARAHIEQTRSLALAATWIQERLEGLRRGDRHHAEGCAA